VTISVDGRTLARYDTSRLFDMADYHAGGKHYNNKMNQSRITNLLGRQLLLARSFGVESLDLTGSVARRLTAS
jgi:hypothetical protein